MKKFKYPVIDSCPDKYLKYNADSSYYYRITKNNPPENSDFLPQYMDKKFQKRRKSCEKKKDNYCLCLMCGLSLFKNEEEAKLMMKRFPNMGRFLFKGYIKMEYGVLKASPSKEKPSHHTWYPFDGVDEKNIFKYIVWDKKED